MCPLLASWNEFAETPSKAPLDGYVKRATYRGSHAMQTSTQNVYGSTAKK
jgi:hypothetical protein